MQQFIFPLGSLTKSDVRKIASTAESPLNDCRILTKKESMGICFIGRRPFDEFLQNYVVPTPGRFIDVDTRRVVGTHSGMELFTIGQGARIGGALSRCGSIGENL